VLRGDLPPYPLVATGGGGSLNSSVHPSLGGPRMPHKYARNADIGGVVNPLSCYLDKIEALGYQGTRDEG